MIMILLQKIYIMKITWFNHRQVVILLTLKIGNFPVPDRWKLPEILLEDRARCGSRISTFVAEKNPSHWLRTVWWKTRGNFDRWHLFIYLISLIYIYDIFRYTSLMISLFWKPPCWKTSQNRNYKTGIPTHGDHDYPQCLRHSASSILWAVIFTAICHSWPINKEVPPPWAFDGSQDVSKIHHRLQ